MNILGGAHAATNGEGVEVYGDFLLRDLAGPGAVIILGAVVLGYIGEKVDFFTAIGGDELESFEFGVGGERAADGDGAIVVAYDLEIGEVDFLLNVEKISEDVLLVVFTRGEGSCYESRCHEASGHHEEFSHFHFV